MPLSVIWLVTSFAIRLLVIHFKLIILLRSREAGMGTAHPKWDERPLVLAVRRQGSRLKAQDLLAFCEGKIAKWWMPDDVLFVDELPHGATGKVLKTKLQELYGNRDPAAISRTKTP